MASNHLSVPSKYSTDNENRHKSGFSDSQTEFERYSREDLINVLVMLEGKLQAAQIAMAVFKNERLKAAIRDACCGRFIFSDPLLALFRDVTCCREQLMDEATSNSIISNVFTAFELLVKTYKRTHESLSTCLQDVKLFQSNQNLAPLSLGDVTASGSTASEHVQTQERTCSCKHSHELEQRQKVEAELRVYIEMYEREKERAKNLVLFLMAERKLWINRYLSERRSAQILSRKLNTERSRINIMAMDLEEESKKSLRLEAEVERHLTQSSSEKVQFKSNLAVVNNRCENLQEQNDRLNREVDRLKQQLSEAHQVAMFQAASNCYSGAKHTTISRPGSSAAHNIYTHVGAHKLVAPSGVSQTVEAPDSHSGHRPHSAKECLSPARHTPHVTQGELPVPIFNRHQHDSVGSQSNTFIKSSKTPTAEAHYRLPMVPSHSTFHSTPEYVQTAATPSSSTRRVRPLGRGVTAPLPPTKSFPARTSASASSPVATTTVYGMSSVVYACTASPHRHTASATGSYTVSAYAMNHGNSTQVKSETNRPSS